MELGIEAQQTYMCAKFRVEETAHLNEKGNISINDSLYLEVM